MLRIAMQAGAIEGNSPVLENNFTLLAISPVRNLRPNNIATKVQLNFCRQRFIKKLEI